MIKALVIKGSESSDSNKENISPSLKVSMSGKSQCIVLPTARVYLHGPKGRYEATLLFDSGSDRSYIMPPLVEVNLHTVNVMFMN